MNSSAASKAGQNVPQIALLAVGTSASRKIDLRRLAGQLKHAKLRAVVLAPIIELPLPSAPHPTYTSSAQYKADQIFYLVRKHYVPPDDDQIICAAIDHEIYNELFSTVDRDGRIIIVSLRNSTLHQIIRAARARLDQYLLLEISIQLLAIRYRTLISYENPDPEQCEPPWHLDRRRCLFDYFGLSPEDTAKLRRAELCDACSAIVSANGDLQQFYLTIRGILRLVTKRTIGKQAERLIADPINAFLLGAIAGAVPTIFSTVWAVSIFSSVLLVILVFQIRRIRSED